jgi:hypothetical protein
MQSSQRISIVGICVLAVGAITTVVRAEAPRVPMPVAWSLAGATGLAIGGSVVAIVLAAYLVAHQVFGLDIDEVVEALRGASPVIRQNQTLDITLTTVEDEVHTIAVHKFELLRSSRRSRILPLRLYTDVGSGNRGGGFSSIVEPGGTTLKDAALARDASPLVKQVEGKLQFENTYRFDHAVPSKFEIATYAWFRKSDRLIWTVEHISKDFLVRIHDYRHVRGEPPSVKINHHRAEEIINGKVESKTDEGLITQYTYLGEILPFQGFELQWAEE